MLFRSVACIRKGKFQLDLSAVIYITLLESSRVSERLTELRIRRDVLGAILGVMLGAMLGAMLRALLSLSNLIFDCQRNRQSDVG